jgi:DNA-binding NarL/FixJ family response regulator
VEPIRIVLAELPRMLRDIFHRSLLTEPDVVLVGETSSPADLERLVKQGGVDVVMLGLSESQLSASHFKLFDIDARVRILAIAQHGRNASLYELRPHRMVLGEGSPQELIQVIRKQVRSPWEWSGARVLRES